MRRLTPMFSLVFLAACGWNSTPHGSDYNHNELWSPERLVAVNGALIAPLTNGQAAWIDSDGGVSAIDLDGGRVRDLFKLPDQTGVAAFIDRTRCVPDGRDDCASTRFESQVAIIEDGVIDRQAPVASHLDTLTVDPTGARAIAWLAGAPPDGPLGVLNLGEVQVVDLDQSIRTPVRVGFAAERVLFDDAGTRALVLSQSEVAVLDLTIDPPVVSITFPLTLDPDDIVVPVGVELTPDGRYALISTQRSGDLYVLDLVDPSVNLISLPAAPSDMRVVAEADETLFVFPGLAQLAVLDHERFDLRTVALDEPMNRIVAGNGASVLYSDVGRLDVYRYDHDSRNLVEYRLLAAPTSLDVTPDGAFAVAFTAPTSAGRPGMELLDLRNDRSDTVPYGLDGAGVGLAFTTASDGSVWALVLQDNVESLWRGELSTGIADVIDLLDRPTRIGDLQDGRFFIAHDNPLGLITLYDPENDTTVEASGFALFDVLDRYAPLPAEDN